MRIWAHHPNRASHDSGQPLQAAIVGTGTATKVSVIAALSVALTLRRLDLSFLANSENTSQPRWWVKFPRAFLKQLRGRVIVV